MARTAVLSREQIIESAFRIADTSGFKKITIRAIAHHLGTSTAPIYTQYSDIEAIYSDLADYVDNKLLESTKVTRTPDPFLNIGVGVLSFALEHKLVFTDFYLTNGKIPFQINRFEDAFITQMKINPLLCMFENERLQSILSDMWIFTYGLAVMICTGTDTSRDLEHYQKKLEQTGERIISYHFITSGKYELCMQKIAELINKQEFKEV